MKQVRFAHLSDTHIPSSAGENGTGEFLNQLGDAGEKLRACLRQLGNEKPDFLLVTGDLVHEGEARDYVRFRLLFEEMLPGVPVVVSLGNHDRREAFYEGYLGQENSAPYRTVHDIDGLRIIGLDSSVPGRENGALSMEQLAWLRDTLAEEAPRGTIVHFHHPVRFQKDLDMKVDEAFYAAINSANVLGVFAGHTHSAGMAMLGGVPQYVADSTAFGVRFDSGHVSFCDSGSYNICLLDEDGLRVFPRSFAPLPAHEVTIDFAALMQAMQQDEKAHSL